MANTIDAPVTSEDIEQWPAAFTEVEALQTVPQPARRRWHTLFAIWRKQRQAIPERRQFELPIDRLARTDPLLYTKIMSV